MKLCSKCESNETCCIRAIETKKGNNLSKCDFFDPTKAELIRQNTLLRESLAKMESVANEWMGDYQELKDIYEPEILIESSKQESKQ